MEDDLGEAEFVRATTDRDPGALNDTGLVRGLASTECARRGFAQSCARETTEASQPCLSDG